MMSRIPFRSTAIFFYNSLTMVLSIVKIFALPAKKTAQKKRNSGVWCVFTRIFFAR